MTTPTTAATDASSTPSSISSSTTTRVCIKNLPLSYTTETKLKSHLQSSQPTLQITDCKILKTKDGKTRKIAFVGYSSSHAAQTAVTYFDKSFIGTSRLSVSLAFSKKNKKNNDTTNGEDNEGEVYRPWSKHSVGSSRYEKLHQQQQENENAVEKEKGKSKNERSDAEDAKSEADRKRDEFLSAMGISTSSSKQKKGEDVVSKSKFWANDDAIVEQPTVDRVKGVDDHTIDNITHHDGTKAEGESDSSDSSSSDGSSESDSENDTTNNNAAGNESTKKKVSSDLDFLKSKQVKADTLSDESDNDHDDSSSVSSSVSDDSSSSDDGSSSSEDENEADKSKSKEMMQNVPVSSSDKAQEKLDTTTNVPPNNNTLLDRLFVRNLPFTTTEEDLIETFSQFGSVASVHIPVDDTKRNKGYAFINFESKKDAKLAMDTMDGQDFQGRLIHILPARPSADQTDIDPNLSYKERQELARQKEAEKSSKGWSASFLRGDAVVDNVANRLGVSKGDVLNVKDGISSGNAAVRLALGETHIITENIAFFEEHGVDVTTLESKSNNNKGGSGTSASKRSKTMILVKNLPYDTTLEELTKVFHEIGGEVPQKMLLPPSKTAALVEYGHATDARRAFRRLAYKKFKHVPLYLEWAPMRTDGKKKEQESGATNEKTTEEIEKKDSSVVKTGLVDEDPSTETADTGVSQTIYVKNLNFSTTEDQLEKIFTQAGCQPRAVKIPTKSAPVKKNNKSKAAASSTSNEMKQLSMGFGFVEFPSEEEALNAIKAMNGKVIDGHALEIKLSTKSLSSSSSARMPPIDKSSKNTKIMVRNVPFEATRTELLQLFGSFGQLKKVRLPKKFDGTHRGFAFCEFVTSKEAQNAMTTLSRTHLYGRHLVLEWATEGGDDGNAAADVGVAREKAKRDAMRAGFGSSAGGSVKRGKHLKF